VHFAAPYFNPYMLGQLKFNYIEYMAIGSLSYFGRVFMFKLLQKRAKARQVNTILLLATLGISTSPLLWAFSQNYWWICAVEFLSGCYWAGFELSTVLLYFQKIDDRERTSVLTYITFLNTTGMLLGSLLGALFMKLLPVGWDIYLTLFTVSTFIRIMLIVSAPQVNFRGQIPKLISFNKVMSVRPPFGAFTWPVVGKIKKKKQEDK
jgi:MFS family permease